MSGEVNVPEKSHAELGASVAGRWMACPGSIRLSREVPVPPTTAYAQEGTAAHALAELSLRRHADPATYVGTTLEGVEVTEEMADHVRVFVDYCRSLPGEKWIEQRFNLAQLNPPGPMFGTADFVCYDGETGTLNVVDLKYGQGVVVEAKGNKQLRYYALGVLLSLGAGFQVDTINMTIVQPRVAHPDGMVRSDAISSDELVGFAADLLAAARETTLPDAPLVPGSHCRFCPASGVCPAQHKRAQEIAMVEFDAVPVLEPRAPSTLSDTELVKVLGLLPMLEDWAAAVRAHAQGKLERGEEVPGVKLVEKRATRKWKDTAETRQWLFAKGYAEDEIAEQKIKSPAQIEKLVGKKNLPPDLVIKVSSGYTMVPASDSRPAVALTPGHEFPALPAAAGQGE